MITRKEIDCDTDPEFKELKHFRGMIILMATDGKYTVQRMISKCEIKAYGKGGWSRVSQLWNEINEEIFTMKESAKYPASTMETGKPDGPHLPPEEKERS